MVRGRQNLSAWLEMHKHRNTMFSPRLCANLITISRKPQSFIHLSKRILERELNYSRRVYRLNGRTERRIADDSDWYSKVCPVQQVKNFGSELKRLIFSESELLVERHIQVYRTICSNCIAPYETISAKGKEIFDAFAAGERNFLPRVTVEENKTFCRRWPVRKIAIKVGIDGNVDRKGLS